MTQPGDDMPSYTSPRGTEIHLSDEEDAGRNALKRQGPKARERAIWGTLVEALEYDAVFDLGANYGQVTLEQIYPPGVPVTMVEANPGLLPFLDRTIGGHPNADAITRHNVALGDHDGEIELYVRHDAVGKSSVIRQEGEALTVPLRRVDSLIDLPASARRAIIKLDVEGAELAVLEGAAGLLGRLDDYAIMIELHPGFMRRTAGSAGHYLEILCGYGVLWERAGGGYLRAFNLHRFLQVGKLTDIVIVSGESYDAALRAYNAEVRARINAGGREPSTPTASPGRPAADRAPTPLPVVLRREARRIAAGVRRRVRHARATRRDR